MNPKDALSNIPNSLRNLLLREYLLICQNYFEHKWRPAELSAGHFCEITFTIVQGFGLKTYPANVSKPRDFVGACRKLESMQNVPRSFQILIPRLLPALYEVRNQRGVGHAGGDVDSNAIDSSFVYSSCSWVIAELIRVFHGLPIEEAQQIVDQLAEIPIPLVWVGEDTKRILDPSVQVEDAILIFLATSVGRVAVSDLRKWTEYQNHSRFNSKLTELHKKRYLEFNAAKKEVQILPPGAKHVSALVDKFSISQP